MSIVENPFFRVGVGLVGATALTLVALLVFKGTIRFLLLGMAAVDLLVTPYVLKRAAES